MFFSKMYLRMKGKEIKTLRFSGFLRVLRLALFAYTVVFLSSTHAIASCKSGYVSQNNVFREVQNCGTQSFGYPHSGNSQINSPISTGDGTWQSNFSSFKVKGRAYCSKTEPNDSASTGSCGITRRPMADSIDTNNDGTQCWCQATEHQQFSKVSYSWSAPFQKIYAKYVYLKDMGEKCTNLCAEYCSYISSNVLLDASVNNTIASNSLRATIYDSLDECIPTENKITYISDGDVVDYQYYTGSLTLKDALEKNDYSFKGWCETEGCDTPLAADETKADWSGEKTLYAKWERNSCETGTKSSIQNGNLVCSTECADGYENSSNPFTRWSGCGANNYGNGVQISSANGEWSAGFTYSDFIMVKGNAYCLAEQYPLPTKISVCGSNITTMPMVEDVDTTKSGNVCWCKVTGWQPFTPGRNAPFQDVEAKYIQVPLSGSSCTPQACGNVCASVGSAGGQVLDGVNNYTDTELRGDIYRSVKKCEIGKYTITFKDGDETVRVIPEYTIETPVTLLPPDGKTGFVFAGWCEDLSNCDNPMIGETSGLFGDVTLYAKWENNLYNAKFYHAPIVRTRGVAADSVLYDTAVVTYDKSIELPYDSPVSGYAVVKYTSDHDLETGEQKETDYLPGRTIDNYMVDGNTEFNVELTEVSTYECESGEYLPAGAVACSACPSGAVCIGGVFDYDKNNDQGIIEMPFGLTTVEMDAGSVFNFDLSAAGTFYVDCGDGGTLSGPGASDYTITRTAIKETYTCTYQTAGVKTIRIGGLATGYRPRDDGIQWFPDISFEGNLYIESLSGDLSAIFPGAPVFIGAFKNCTNLKTIPGTLFSNYTTGPKQMFVYTFSGCSKLTEIPNGLFSNIDAGSEDMFWGTFAGCTGLESLPNGMFANITTGADRLFEETFKNCSGLKSLPENMFSGITSAFSHMFYRTFQGCTGLTGYIPPTMFSGLIANGHPNETSMMTDIFENTGLLTSCPIGMQKYITGYEGYWNYKVNGYWGTKVSCEYADYTLNFMDGENSFGSPVTYKITDEINMPTIDDASFMGWCVDAPNCASSAVISTGETYTGWYGDKILYARYRATECESGEYLTDYQCVSCPEDYPSSNGGTQCYKECIVKCTEHAESCNYDSNVIDFVDYYNADNNHVPCNLVSVSCEQHYDYNSNDKTCVPHNYTITYMSGEDVINGLTPTSYTIESDAINLVTPVKSGYRFDGWYADSSLEGDSVAQIATGSTGNKTFYAKWTAIDYDITYELSTGGSWPIGVLHPDSYTIESSTINLATPVKTGYDFDGWYTDSLFEGNPVTQIDAGSVGDKTFYAKWNPIVYTINYELSSGGYWPTGTLHPETYTIESDTITLSTPSRVGYYRFDGWCDDEQLTQNCTDQKTISAGSTGDRAFYAKWIVGTPSSITCDNGYNENNVATAVLDASIDASAYAFYNYTGGAKIIDQNLPRIQDGRNRGQWGANFVYGNVYGVSSCNSTIGSIPPSVMEYSVSGASTMENSANGQWCWCKMTDFIPTDQVQVDTPDTPWVFVKYFSHQYGQYECQTTCTKNCIEKVASDQFYRAQLFGEHATCTPALYDIVYHANDGSMDSETNWPEKYSIVSGTVTLPNNVTKEFYNFGGWCDTPELKSCSMSKTIPTGSYGEKNFYAKWVGDKHYLHFAPNTVLVEKNSPGTMPDQDAYYGDVYLDINPNTFVRNGYEFNGWGCIPEGESEPIQLSESMVDGVKRYTIDEYSYPIDTTCTAQWKPQDYTITYGNISVDDSYPMTFTVESGDVAVPNPTPSSIKTEFKGWCVGEEDDCDNTQLQKNYVIPSESLGDVTLWAHFGPAVFNITYYYDENDYIASPSVPLTNTEGLPTTYTYGTETSLVPLEDQERHAFVGWYDVDNIEGDAVTKIPDDTIGNKSFVAKWGPTLYKITYYFDADKSSVFKKDAYTAGDADITELPTPTKAKFRFDGWRNAEDDELVEKITTSDLKDIELYATWTRIGCDDGYYLPVGTETCQKCPSNFPYSNGDNAKTKGYCYAVCRASSLVYPYCANNKPGKCQYYDYFNNQYLSQSNFCNSAVYMSIPHQQGSLGTCNQDWFVQMYSEHPLNSNRACEVKITECEDYYHTDTNGKVCLANTYNIAYSVKNKNLTEEEVSELGLSSTYRMGQEITLVELDASKPDNVFAGWCLNKQNCTADELLNGTVVASAANGWGNDVTLYAQWRLASCDEGQYINGESCGTCPVNFPYSDGLGVTDGTCYAKCPQEIVSCPEHSVCEYDTYVDNNIDYKTMTNHTPCGIVVTDCQKGYALSDGVCVLDPESLERYTITYNTNGGELSLALAVPYSFTEADLPISLTNVIPSKSGYSFKGWCDNEDLTIGCSLNKTISSEGNVELYAKWARENYTITYYNGDEVVSASYLPGQYTYGAGITSLPDLEEPYYSFGGWFDENGVKVTEIPSNATGDKQLYAQLAPVEYSLTFKTNFSEKSSGEYTIDDVGEALPALPETVAGYNVRGWYTSAGYETANFSKVTTDLLDYARSASTASDNASSMTRKLTLYADAGYTGCKDGYDAQPTASAVLDSMINIELSDDNVAVAYKKLNSNTKQTADALPLVNNTAPAGIWGLYIDSAYGIYGTSMCSTDQGTAPSNAMMYSTGNDINSAKGNACWCKMTKYFMYDEDAASPLDATGTPWVYLKEYENSDIGNQNCLDSCTISCYRAVAADKSFRNQLFGEYSLCKLGVYDITYVLNGGEFDSGTDAPEQYTVVYKDITIPNTVSRGNHYTFDGWCTDSELTNCSKTRTIPTGSYGDKTFYAKWSPEQYSITYNIGDGASWAGDVHPATYTYGQMITISNPLRNGYNFVGWCDNAENNCGDNELQKPFIINNKSGNITLFARWEIEEYPINYLECTPYDDASCTDTAIREYLLEVASLPSVYRLGDSTPLPQPYEQDYYNFAGWCVDAKSCALNSTISSVNPTWTGAKNLYTKWSPKTYTVYYRCEEDGENIDRTLNITYGENYDINDILGGNIQISQLCSLPDGYEFDGWDCPCKHQYNKEDETSGGASAGGTASGGGSGSGSATDKPIWDTGSITCTLKRKPINYTITYHLNGGNNNAENPETYNVQSDTFSLEAPIKSKHDFVAWCTDEQLTQNCESNPIITKGTIGNKDFYAKWVSTACEDGYYLDNANCQKCPDAFPYSNGDSATTKDSCYAICTASRLASSCSVAAENACAYKYTDDNLCANELHLPTNYSLESCGNGYYVEMLGNRQSNTQSCQVVMTGCQEHYNLSDESCVGDVYSITYYDGEENITESKNLNPKTHTYGQSTTLPSIIFKEHYNFAGWYNNSALEGAAVSTIAADDYTDDINGFKFYAKWTPVFCATDEIEVYENDVLVCKPTKYTIEYHYDNKIETLRANFTDNVNLKTLDDKTGYIFANWCIGRANCGIQNGVLSLPANSITETMVRLYPQWNIVNYDINYENMQNATWPNGRPIYTYNIESDDIYIDTPKKNGFEFDGWCDADMENCSKNVTIPTGSTGSKTFYAKWTEIEEFECESGRWLHIDNDVNAKACLSLTKVGSPAVVVQVGKTPYYLQMTENPNVSVNEDYNTKLRVRKGNKTFNVHDASVGN